MDDDGRVIEPSGADDPHPLREGRKPLDEESANPPGIGRGECDAAEEDEAQDESCDLETTAQVEDLVLEETKPGYGIPGFEAEEVGGG